MSKRNNDAKAENSGRDEAKRQKTAAENDTPQPLLSNSITDAAVHLHSLLQSKEKELKEREADFNRRVNLFETENPSMGKDTDVIQLNVGGVTNIAVLRGTLTQFEDSMLAAKFGGRWDDSLEKDRVGNFFVDQDPENFQRLITYLRLRSNRPDANIIRPEPTYEFCNMLEYYGLMSGIYPQKWFGITDKCSCEEQAHGAMVMSTDEAGPITLLHNCCEFENVGVAEFTVEFEKGTAGAVGWLERNPSKGNITRYPTGSVDKNSIFFSITEQKIVGPDGVMEENMRINHIENTTKIICRSSGDGKYSVEVVGLSPPGGSVANLQSVRYSVLRVFPMISFCGKVTVSSLKYDIDKLPSASE